MLLLLRILSGFALYFSLLTLFRFPSAWVGTLKGISKDKHILWLLSQLAANFLSFFVAVPKWLAGNLMIPACLIGIAAVTTGLLRNQPAFFVIGSAIVLISLRHIVKVMKAGNIRKWIYPPILSLDDVLSEKDVEIGTWGEKAHPLLGDIWMPRAGAQRSGLGIIFLHSGSWNALQKGMTMKWLFRHLVRRGHLILDLGFPLAPEADMQQIINSVKSSVIWLRSTADQYKIDPKKIVLWGISGGGHLALQAAYSSMTDSSDAVAAVISCYGPSDMAAHFNEFGRMEPAQPMKSDQITSSMQPKKYNKTWLDRILTETHMFPEFRYQNMPGGALLLVNLMGGTLLEKPEMYHQFSPINHVSKDSPPTLQIWPAHDFYFSAVLHGRPLHKKLTAAGVKSIYLELPDTEHGFDHFLAPISPAAYLEAKTIEVFLDEL